MATIIATQTPMNRAASMPMVSPMPWALMLLACQIRIAQDPAERAASEARIRLR